MTFKEKSVGIILIIIGLLPFLLNIAIINNFITSFPLVHYLVPGELVYQAVLILLGIFLFYKVRPDRHVN